MTRRQGRLVEPLATATGQARAHDALHHEAAGDVFQLLGDIFADPLETAAAIGASLARRQNRLFTRQMLRQGAALRLPFRSGRRLGRRLGRARDLLILQPELELVEASEVAPKRCRRRPASWCLSFSIRRSRLRSSAREVSTIAFSAAMSSGRDWASSSMATP